MSSESDENPPSYGKLMMPTMSPEMRERYARMCSIYSRYKRDSDDTMEQLSNRIAGYTKYNNKDNNNAIRWKIEQARTYLKECREDNERAFRILVNIDRKFTSDTTCELEMSNFTTNYSMSKYQLRCQTLEHLSYSLDT